ncbi:uncharacterized protein LOC123876153 [Maniola jurtina]|uniref:uncharacterized protein LOC123876153 n=1 Tax=Maniola jurtina TaxID=191418 RepID=UPI001E68A376|nr:uncharacterized protein LOC123876153 [Maniola jurtina]XP_045778270.1 uncharacterized protein LOC123876153 [Maniola jurtina]
MFVNMSASPSEASSPPLSPIRRLKIHKGSLSSNEKQLVLNFYTYIIESKTDLTETDVIKTVSDATGVSQASVYNIVTEFKTTHRLQPSPVSKNVKHSIADQLDDSMLSRIRQKVHDIYLNNDLPTVTKVLEAVNSDPTLPNLSKKTLSKVLEKLKIKHVKKSGESTLLDRHSLQSLRTFYLVYMRDFRKENRKIYYLGETWICEGHTTNSASQNPKKCRGFIVGHIGSDTGFLEGGVCMLEATQSDAEYHKEMDTEDFEEWFTKILDLIEPGSVIVLNSTKHHSRNAEPLPNIWWLKKDIHKWLNEKQIPYSEDEIKVELIVKIDKEKYTIKYIDAMAQKRNVAICRVPPYHSQLNPMELIWAEVKSHVGRNNTTCSLSDTRCLLEEGLASIGAAQWKAAIDQVVKEEQQIFHLQADILDEL